MHRCGRNYEISKEENTCKKGVGLCSGTRTTGIPHTMQRTPLKRNGQKGMLGTRITHVLCPVEKSLRSNGERNSFGRRGRTFLAELARVPPEDEGDKERCWHLTTMGKSHLNSLTDMSNAFSCTWEKNEQMFKGPMDVQRLRMVWSSSRDTTESSPSWCNMDCSWGRRSRHGFFHGLSTRPSKDWKLNHQTSPITILAALFCRNERNECGRLMERHRRRPVHQIRATYHTADSAKDVILHKAASLDHTLAEDRKII